MTLPLCDHTLMTMKRRAKRVGAAEFKARCLALLDEVSETGRHLVVTKRGRPVAEVAPVEAVPSLAGSVLREKDLIAPLDESWIADS